MRRRSTDITVAHRAAPLTLHLFWPDGVEPLHSVLFSHGDGLSPPDYAPLLDAWTGHGLAIAAPDHADETLCPLWLARVLDMRAAADYLAVPIRLAGHSYGGHTVAVLLGARPTLVACPDDLALKQADAGLLLAPPGDGSPASLTPEWAGRAPYLCLDLAGFCGAALILAGGCDDSPITRRGWRWQTDLFTPSPPAAKYLAVAPAGDHYLGGIAAGRGTRDPALFGDIATTTADFLRRGPAWTPRPAGSLIFTAHPGMHPKGHPA